MALQLNYTNDQDFTGNYWRISHFNINYKPNLVECRVSLFKDAAAAAAGKAPMLENNYVWQEDDGEGGPDEFTGWFDSATLDVVSQNPQERAYVKLKTLTEFTGAIDV